MGCCGGSAPGRRRLLHRWLELLPTVTLWEYLPLTLGAVQWDVLPRASCWSLHLDFSLLNWLICPIVLDPPSLWTMAVENHQLQPSSQCWIAETTFVFGFSSVFTVTLPGTGRRVGCWRERPWGSFDFWL